MTHHRIIIIGLLALGTSCVKARPNDVKVIAKGLYHCAPPQTDKKSNTAEWHSTENRHSRDTTTVWVSGIDVKKGLEEDFQINDKQKSSDFVTLYWQLTEEADRTVMHCYFPMPANAVTNLWLASEETAIVDRETGVQYRAKSTADGCWKQYFGVKAPEGTVLDFKIYFPKLPESVRKIAIYGIPAWGMRGENVILARTKPEYDKAPEFRTPRLVKSEDKYDKNNSGTWSVYTDTHLIKPVKENTMALWLTPEATYLAIAKEQNWMREYYGMRQLTALFDEHPMGKRYELRSIQGLPVEHIFWIEGYSGDCQAFLLEFEPLPLDVTTICFFEPDGEPFNAWGANWKGLVFNHLDVETLRANQSLFKYKERVVVE